MKCPHCGEETASVKLCVSVPRSLLEEAEKRTGLVRSALIQHALTQMVTANR